MEVFDSQSQTLVANMTSKVPVFDVKGLESNVNFDISLYATNSKGHSDYTYLKVLTLKDAEKRTAYGETGHIFDGFEITPLIIIGCGAGAVAILIILISVLIVKLKRRKTHKKTLETVDETEKYPACEDDNNPDVIPQSNGNKEKEKSFFGT